MYFKKLKQGYILQNSQPEQAARLEALQRIVFPTLSAEEIMTEKHYRKHIEIFPEGQFVLLNGDQVIGMSTTIRYHLAMEDHSFLEVSDNLWMTTHEPEGEWLYGMDVGVHPDYRKQGLARELYRARQETCRALGLKGQITAGMPNGYYSYAADLTLDEYYEALVKGQIKDPTVSAQQKIGFELVRMIHNYLQDPQCGNGSILMILPVEKDV
jgi:GNAT superfamily N-acetyltransferase